MRDSQIAVALKVPSNLVRHIRLQDYSQAINELEKLKDNQDKEFRDNKNSIRDMVSNVKNNMADDEKLPVWVMRAKLDIQNMQNLLETTTKHDVRKEIKLRIAEIYNKLKSKGYTI